MGRNPLTGAMSPRQSPQSLFNGPGGKKNLIGLISDFRKFAQEMTPERAEKEIARLLGTGEMTKEQFLELKQNAEFLMQFLK